MKTVSRMSVPEQHVIISDMRRYSHLKVVPIKDIDHEKPLLIRQNNVQIILVRQIRTGLQKRPVASRYRLTDQVIIGWKTNLELIPYTFMKTNDM